MSRLRRDLKDRHITLIALGGVIGGGLFVGSGSAIHTIGPAALVSYAVGAVLVILVMRMLAEMAIARPASGSWSEYAREAHGPWAGFISGWLYWYLWIVTIAFEATVGASIIGQWVTIGPDWAVSLALLLLLTATNLFTVRAFGEFEFWFSSIKVTALLVFLALGVLAILGAFHDADASVGNLTADGGFLPNGAGVVLTGIVTLILAYGGVETATIAAAEADDPGRAVRRASATLVWRVAVFYIGSLFVVLCVLRWTDVPTDASPFAAALDALGIPAAATVLNAVVLTAVLSVLNAGLYVSSRMVLSLGAGDQAHPGLARLNHRGVPVAALALTVAASAAVIGIAYLSPGSVFAFLTTSIGAIIVIDYVIIAATHIRLRHRLERDGHPPPTLAMWMFPWLSYATLIALLAILVSMAFLDDLRKQLLYSLASVAAIAATGIVRQRLHGEPRQPHSAPRADPSHPASVIAGADGGSRSRAPSTP